MGSSLFEHDGTLSCQGQNPGKCIPCPSGMYKSSKGSTTYDDQCKICPRGKEANSGQNECRWCDASLQDVKKSEVEVGMSGPGTRLGHFYKASPGADFCNATACLEGQFPNTDRSLCLAIDSVTWNVNSDASSSSYDYIVSWTPKNMDTIHSSSVAVNLVPLQFIVRATHGICKNGAGKEGTDVHTGVESWVECANLCNIVGARFCNHNEAKKICNVLRSVADCLEYPFAKGWFALEVVLSIQEERSVASTNTSSNSRNVTLTAQNTGSSCLKDNSTVMAHVALLAFDKGTYTNGSGITGLSLKDQVFGISTGSFIEGNTAPILPRNVMSVFPKVIYPTTPWISCALTSGNSVSSLAIDPDNRNNIRVASYAIERGKNVTKMAFARVDRSDRLIIDLVDYLLDTLAKENFAIEPIDPVLWPGDLQHLSQSMFPRTILENSDLLRNYVTNCLSDTNAVSDSQMKLLSMRVANDKGWTTFAESDGLGKTSFGRSALHGTFQQLDLFRCAVALTDSCEVGRKEKSKETNVTPLGLKNKPNSGAFDAIGTRNIEILGAGFLAENSQYICKWSQPSVKAATYSQSTPGEALSFGSIECQKPEWLGGAGSVELTLAGPILEYAGCIDLDLFVDATNIENNLPNSHLFAVHHVDSATEKESHTGLASCQLHATKRDSTSNVFALHHNGVGGAGYGCAYVSNTYGESLFDSYPTKSAVGRVSDNNCDATCATTSGSSDASIKQANDFDMLQPQRCGSKNGKYASVFVARAASDLSVGMFDIVFSLPGPPVWDNTMATDNTVVLPAGMIEIHWNPPVFLGGSPIISYEVKFKYKIWQSMDLIDNTANIFYPSSHAALCEDNALMDSKAPVTRGLPNNAGSTYRLCEKNEIPNHYISCLFYSHAGACG